MAFSLGISITEFKHLNPRKLALCIEGEKMRQRRIDTLAWTMAREYGIPMIALGANNGILGKKKVNYPELPNSEKVKGNTQSADDEEIELSPEELQRQREEFVRKMRMMKINWDLRHSNDKKGRTE